MPKKTTKTKTTKKETAAKKKTKTADKKTVKKEDKTVKTKSIVEKKEKIIKKKAVDEEKNDEVTQLVPADDYLSTGIHIGAKHKTKFMKKYVYKVRPDGLCILNVKLIDDKIKQVSDLINKYEPNEILIGSRKDTASKPLKLLNKATGINISIGRYLPGTLTNPNYEKYSEPKIVMVTDVWHDKILLVDALKSGAVIIGLCNTNNTTSNVDLLIPCNNKGKKSLALIYWILANEYCKAHKIKFDYKQEDFF